ncbi:MAG TPA: allantoicase [Streptosporangiaceae bacterium]
MTDESGREQAGPPEAQAGPPEAQAGTGLPDLASRALRGSVVAASDDFFADAASLISPRPPVHQPGTFGPRGQLYDGWETRRRHLPDGSLPGPDAHDWVVVRLGAPGVPHAVVVDTAFFTGNYPQSCSVQACTLPGYPGPAELAAAAWEEIVPRSPLSGGQQHTFPVTGPARRRTHVRLNIFPDGGVARLRVHGEVVADPALADGLTVDLAAAELGADVVDCSDRYFSAPRNALAPGLPAVMGEGWETRRRRDTGNDWLIIRLAAPGVIALAEIDTLHYKGNAPGAAMLSVTDARRTPPGGPDAWTVLLPRTRLQPDTAHRFRVAGPPEAQAWPPEAPAGQEATHARLDIYPDGGVARLRLYGSVTASGLAGLRQRWAETG